MTDAKLAEALGRIGVDPEHVGLVALLPLVHVAWADGVIQPGERELVLGLAGQLALGEAERAILDGWLAEAPSAWFYDTALKVLQALEQRARTPEGLSHRDVVEWCWALAGAAGGVFGTSWLAIDKREREVIDQIAKGLGIAEVPGDLARRG